MAVYVGDDQRPFQIHKQFLCSKSTYFKAAFGGSFKEATEKKLHLLDEDPNIFQFYAAWIYSPNLEIRGNTDEEFDVNLCCRLYILADKLGSEDLQNTVMDVMHKHITGFNLIDLKSETVNFVYNNTLSDCVLREILVHALAWQMTAENHPDLINAVPEFLFAALKICTERLPGRLEDEIGPLDKNLCDMYHVHSSSVVCPISEPADEESDSEPVSVS